VLDKYIVPGKVFIDIGAWCGIFSLYAERLGAEVHAVEPDPVAFSELMENANEITCYNIAIANADGICKINTTAINGFGNSETSLIDRPGIKAVNFIRCNTLEKLCNQIGIENICLIKMDVEGAEVIILKQAKDFLQKHKPPMWISFHPGYFENIKDDVETISNILSDIYDFNANNFRIALYLPSAFHTFLFLPK
jgi:FkbM family methyltransferase